MRRWLVAHWFGAVALLIGGLWIATLIAYAVGAEGISVGSRRTGQRATLDFMRRHDQPVLGLRPGVGLSLYAGARADVVGGTVVRLRPAPPVLCWVCGDQQLAGGLAIVSHRAGDWLYRAPTDRPPTHAPALAYHRGTGELLPGGAGAAAEAAVLAGRGLIVSEATRLRRDGVADLTTVSMLREGCVIFNAAYVLLLLLWLVVGGGALLIGRLVRRRA